MRRTLLQRHECQSTSDQRSLFSLKKIGLMKYVVLKGSITIDGVSLTVNEVGDDWLGLSLIPETLALTTLGSKKPGDKVNVEADVMAKHIERLIEARNN